MDLTSETRLYTDCESENFIELVKVSLTQTKTLITTASSVLYVRDFIVSSREEDKTITQLKQLQLNFECNSNRYFKIKDYCIVNIGGAKYVVEGSTDTIASQIFGQEE